MGDEMFARVFKGLLCGLVIGLLLGVLAGGVSSTLFGQPFSGVRGLKVFHLGMFFPGLVVFAPVTSGIGAVLGAIFSWSGKASDEDRQQID